MNFIEPAPQAEAGVRDIAQVRNALVDLGKRAVVALSDQPIVVIVVVDRYAMDQNAVFFGGAILPCSTQAENFHLVPKSFETVRQVIFARSDATPARFGGILAGHDGNPHQLIPSVGLFKQSLILIRQGVVLFEIALIAKRSVSNQAHERPWVAFLIDSNIAECLAG